ncbi:MAG TPA: hypothetical protein VJ438_03680 [Candidatus Nanoarchaeia archaeon]|nr:hypothetical protein [Candidatus Nanoarchaeia archaeon]
MEHFPEQSVKLAREIAGKYRKRTSSKSMLAAYIYNNNFLHIGYGFSESIKKGNCGRFLHEIDKETDCFTMAGVLYLVAKEAGLKPELYYVQGMRDTVEGDNREERGRNDHSFITVRTGKNEQVVIDPFMELFGDVKFNKKNNKMKVYFKSERQVTERDYQLMMKLSEQEYVKRLQKQRTPEGGRIALSATQRLSSSFDNNVYLTFLSEESSLKSSLHFTPSLFHPDPYNQAIMFDLVTRVNKDGTFSFDDGTFLNYNAEASGWTQHTNPQIPFSFSVKDAQKMFKIFDEFMRLKGRKSPISRMFSFKLAHALYSGGFYDDFTTLPNTLARKVVAGSKDWKDILGWQEQISQNFAKKAREDERTYKTLLREAHRTKKVDKAYSRKNPLALTSTEHQRIKLIEEGFEKYSSVLRGAVETIIQGRAIASGIKKGSKYHAERKTSQALVRKGLEVKYFEQMAQFNGSSFPFAFHIVADKSLDFKQFDLQKMSVPELRQGLTQKDIQRAAQRFFFLSILNSWHLKDALFLKQYKRGLEKILDSR